MEQQVQEKKMFKSILRLERINEEDNVVMYQYQGKGVTNLIHYKQQSLVGNKKENTVPVHQSARVQKGMERHRNYPHMKLKYV